MSKKSVSVAFRTIDESEVERLLPLVADDPLGVMTPELFESRLNRGEYHLDRVWIAEDERAADDPAAPPLALALWWGHPGTNEPLALDCVLVREEPVAGKGNPGQDAKAVAVVADLLATAHDTFAMFAADKTYPADEGAPTPEALAQPPAYHMFLPPDWREQPAVAAAVAWRIEAARRAGLAASLERLRYEWTPAAGIPQPSGRLVFRDEPDDEVFVDLFRRVLTGTLDATSDRAAANVGAEAQARGDVAFYRDQMVGLRSWWQLAQTPDGTTVGFGLPSSNHESPVVGYLGVLPEHRGHAYSGDILAEITRFLADVTGARRIAADTDLTNAPMAAAFERTGYRNNGRRIVLSVR